MELHDLMTGLRDLVYKYDELISKTKLWYGRLNNDNVNDFNLFLNEVNRIIDDTVKILSIYNNAKQLLREDTLSDYVTTYYMYLKLVSLPYTRDLLIDIENKALRKNILISKLDETIRKTERLINEY